MHTSNQCSWRERGVFIEYAIDLIYLPFRIPGAKGWKPWQHSSISSGVAWHLSNAFSSCLFKYRKGGNQKEIKRAMEEKTGCGLTHFSSGWVQFWLCIRMAHTHTHTHPSPTHTFTYTHQTNSKHANRHFSQKTHTHTHASKLFIYSEKADSGCRNTLAQVRPTLHLTHLNELLGVQMDNAVIFSTDCGQCFTEEDALHYTAIWRPLDFITATSLTSHTSWFLNCVLQIMPLFKGLSVLWLRCLSEGQTASDVPSELGWWVRGRGCIQQAFPEAAVGHACWR